LYVSHSFGQSWSYAGNGLPAGAVIDSIAVSPQDPLIVYVGLDNSHPGIQQRIFRSDDGGISWRPANVGISSSALILQVTINPLNSDIAYAAAYEEGVYKTTTGGRTWTNINSGLPAMPHIMSIAIDYSGNFVL